MPEKVTSQPQGWLWLAVSWEWLLPVIGCAACCITVARGGYTGVLLFAITCAALAAILAVLAIWRGRLLLRLCALLGSVPLFFIVAQFLQRF